MTAYEAFLDVFACRPLNFFKSLQLSYNGYAWVLVYSVNRNYIYIRRIEGDSNNIYIHINEEEKNGQNSHIA